MKAGHSGLHGPAGSLSHPISFTTSHVARDGQMASSSRQVRGQGGRTSSLLVQFLEYAVSAEATAALETASFATDLNTSRRPSAGFIPGPVASRGGERSLISLHYSFQQSGTAASDGKLQGHPLACLSQATKEGGHVLAELGFLAAGPSIAAGQRALPAILQL